MKSGSAGEKKQDEKIELKGGQAKEKGKNKIYGLGGRAERTGRSPWEADTRESKKGQSMEAGREEGRCQAHSGWQTLSSRRRITIIRGWIIIRLLTAGFQLQHKQIIIPHCQPPPVGVRCPQIQGKRLGKLHGQENP